jgi:SAM-dependent methyltransferase
VAHGPRVVHEPGSVLAGAAVALARRDGIRLPGDLALLAHEPAPFALPDGVGPELLGALHESLLGRPARRGRGAYYTPADVAARLVGWAVEGLDRPVVLDPACGGGAFLLDAARHTDRLVAIDIDPLAVAVTEAALFLATGRRPVTHVGDALVDEWPAADVVVGNPPFLSQLRGDTARSRDRAAALGAKGYVDDAALFLLAAARHAGRVALLQPESIVSAASAASVRAEVGPLVERIWVPDRPLFDAAVRVVGVVLDRRAAGIERWSSVVADARGVPSVDIGPRGTLGERCEITAGFRDEYYGLAPFVRERDGAPLITCGLIDPASCRWGAEPARYGRRRWAAPAVDLDGLASSSLAGWADRQLVPKVLVATQTRVIEAVVDEVGAWLPCTPVLSVVPVDLDLWHVLAVLLAPPVSAWALREAGGAALSGDAVKLSATQLRAIPLPAAGPDWDDAAVALRSGDVLAAGAAMGRAYGIDVLGWWSARLPYRGDRD